MRLIPGGRGGKGGGQEPPPPEPPADWEFNPATEALSIDIPPEHRKRTILARQQKLKDPMVAEEFALFLRLKGYTLVEIGTELACSAPHARNLINRGIARRKPELDKQHQEHIEEQLMQIDLLMSTHMKRIFDPNSGRVCVLLMERKAKLLGLDKPTRIEQVPPAAPLEAEVDMSLLTVEELKQYREFVVKILERKARLPIEGKSQAVLEHEPGGGDE
jgi:hypothetical protein